jgi:hypothetical protein
MTGQAFHELMLAKWGRSYDVQLRRTQGKIFVQVMWKFWGQASYSRNLEDHLEHLTELGNYIQALGGADAFQASVTQAKGRPRIGKPVTIPLEVDLGDRASEWMLDS